MKSYGMPVTGGSIAIGPVLFNQLWLLAAGLGLMLVAVLVIRGAWRSDRTVTDA